MHQSASRTNIPPLIIIPFINTYFLEPVDSSNCRTPIPCSSLEPYLTYPKRILTGALQGGGGGGKKASGVLKRDIAL